MSDPGFQVGKSYLGQKIIILLPFGNYFWGMKAGDRLFRVSGGAKPERSSMMDDLESALRNLGYKDKEVEQLVDSLVVDSSEPKFETLLREALNKLRKGQR